MRLLYSTLSTQLSRGVLRKRYYENIHQDFRRTPMPKCDCNKLGKQLD